MTVHSIGANFAGVSMVTGTLGANDPEVGTRLRYGDEDYIFVYNAGTTQISPGYAAILSAVTGYSVTVSSTTSVDLCVGVCKHATMTTATYGWLLTKGFGKVVDSVGNGIAAGSIVILAADGKVTAKTVSTDFVGPVLGKCMGAIASASSGDCYISVGA
jgi:hypothetical protein